MVSKNTATLFMLASLLLMSVNASADAQKIAQQCAVCHGKDGASTEHDFPIIGGLPKDYMITNMAAYKDKERPCPEHKIPSGPKKGQSTDMCRIASELSEADVKELADYFSGKKFVSAKQPFEAAKAKHGKQVHERSCEKCHSEGGTESEDDTGRLAGQWKSYLELSLKQFKNGERTMPKKMKPKIEALGAEDMDALVHFYISQQ
ncbi:MAG TPA: c-type cytochrome [Gammaproteobacteria bacterium]